MLRNVVVVVVVVVGLVVCDRDVRVCGPRTGSNYCIVGSASENNISRECYHRNLPEVNRAPGQYIE